VESEYTWMVSIPHGFDKFGIMMLWLLTTFNDDKLWQFKMDASKNVLCPLFKHRSDACWFWLVWI